MTSGGRERQDPIKSISYKITTRKELVLFWRYAIQHPDVWTSLRYARMEHDTLGRGTIVLVNPQLNSQNGPKVYIMVLFDNAQEHKKLPSSRSKRLLLPYVLNEGRLKWLEVPRTIADTFRSCAGRTEHSPSASFYPVDAPPLPPRKKTWRRFQELVESHRIRCLYHFTDYRNLESIRSHGGLYSPRQCKQRGISVAAPGGNEGSRRTDQRRGLQDYVHLSLNPRLPMMYVARREGRLKYVKILQIDPSVIYLEPTLFSDVNALDREARLGSGIESFERIDLGLATGPRLYMDLEQTEKKRFQAEVLVKCHVPLNLISNL